MTDVKALVERLRLEHVQNPSDWRFEALNVLHKEAADALEAQQKRILELERDLLECREREQELVRMRLAYLAERTR